MKTCGGCDRRYGIYCNYYIVKDIKFDTYTNIHYSDSSGKWVKASEMRSLGECGEDRTLFIPSFSQRIVYLLTLQWGKYKWSYYVAVLGTLALLNII